MRNHVGQSGAVGTCAGGMDFTSGAVFQFGGGWNAALGLTPDGKVGNPVKGLMPALGWLKVRRLAASTSFATPPEVGPK